MVVPCCPCCATDHPGLRCPTDPKRGPLNENGQGRMIYDFTKPKKAKRNERE